MSNKITAYFKGRVGVAESVYQNDYGMIMSFDGIYLPAHFDCYFSLLNQEEGIPGVGADNQVAIPNSVLANPGTVTIHIPLHTGENDSEVEYVVYFKVIGRARPVDDGTPTQMTAIEQALALLQKPIGNIEQIVSEALSFTGETFEEMQEDLDEWKGGVEESLDTWKDGVEDDFDSLAAEVRAEVGTPLVSATVAGMTDHTKIYVYTGSESGYTSGNWYYWNGSAWTSGGVYNSTAFVTDITLALSGSAADAKVVGDKFTDVKAEITQLDSDLGDEETARINANDALSASISNLGTHKVAQPLDENNQPTNGTSGQSLRTKGDGATEWADVGLPTDEQTAQAVSDWLDEHPEATTTVQDGSLTEAKFTDELKLKTIKDYVTPEMFGAKGDGVTDDTQAIQDALDNGGIVLCKGTYLISSPLNINAFTRLEGNTAGYGIFSNSGETSYGSEIIASDDFTGDYMLITVPYEYEDLNIELTRSVTVNNISFDCNDVTGGIKAIALYDACSFTNINIINVGTNKRGFYSPYEKSVSQTVLMQNVFVQHSSSENTDNDVAIIHLERWQECTLINVKGVTNKGIAFGLHGCHGLVLIMCAGGDLASDSSIAYLVRNYGNEGKAPLDTDNVSLISCLNENCDEGLNAICYKQYITGTFSEYSSGTKITQGQNVGFVTSGTASWISVIMTKGSLSTGECSIGTIASVAPLFSTGLNVYNLASLTGKANATQTITVEGFGDSFIAIGRIRGSNVKTDIVANNNNYTIIKYAPSVAGTITTDGSTQIEPAGEFETTVTTNDKSVQLTGYMSLGGKAVIHSNGNTYRTRVYLGTNEFGLNSVYLSYYTKAVFEIRNGMWYLCEFDGVATDGSKVVKTRNYETITPFSTSFQYNNLNDNLHFINSGADTVRNINVGATYDLARFAVTAVSYDVSVNITGSGFAFADGTTTKVVSAGTTKRFIRSGTVLLEN